MCDATDGIATEWFHQTMFDWSSAAIVLQVDQLDSAARYGGAFNQPQYLHLKESISSIIQHLNNLQVRHSNHSCSVLTVGIIGCSLCIHADADALSVQEVDSLYRSRLLRVMNGSAPTLVHR